MASNDKIKMNAEIDIQLSKGSKEAIASVNKADQAVRKLTGAKKEAAKQDKKNNDQAKKNNAQRKMSIKSVTKTVAAYMLVGKALSFVWEQGKKLGMEMLELERDLSKVAAVTGSTIKSLKSLKATVISTSASFNVGTAEIGKFALTMSKLGLSAEDIKRVSKEAVALSKILGEDMSESGTLIVTTLKAFNKTMSESAKVSSVFYELIRKTPASIKELRTAMQYVAPAAAATGVAIEEAGRMMQLLFDRGLKASKIGTGLRNMFSEISKSGEDVMGVLRRMSEEGFSFADAVDQFGKRGAIAATILVQNFGELEQLMGEDMPNSFEVLNAALKATTNTLDWWGRLWESIKLPFAGQEAFEEWKKNNSLRSLSEYIKDEQIPDIIKDLENGFSLEEIAMSLGISKTKSVYTSGGNFGGGSTTDVKTDEYKGLEEMEKLFKKQEAEAAKIKGYKEGTLNEISNLLLGRDAVTTGDTKNRDTFQTILNEYIIDAESGQYAIKKIGQMYKDKAALKEFDDVDQQMVEIQSKELQTAQTVANSITSRASTVDETIAAYRKYYDAQGEFIALDSENQAEIEEWLKDGQARETQIKALCKANNRKVHALGLCKDNSGDTDSSTDLGGLSSGRDVDDLVPEFSEGEWKRRIEASLMNLESGGDINSISGTLGDYYNEVVDKIVNAEEEAMIDLDIERQRIDDEYGALVRDLQAEVDGSTGKTQDGYKAQLVTAAKEYGAAIKDVEAQEVKVMESSSEAKAKAYEKYIDMITKLREKKEALDKAELKNEGDNLKKYLMLISDAIGALADIYNKFNQEMLNNKLESISSELEAVQHKKEVENDILTSQFESGIITAEAYEKKRRQLEKKEVDEKNRLNKKAFDAQKKSDIQSAIVNGLAQAAQAFVQSVASTAPNIPLGLGLGAASSGIVLAKSAAEVGAIQKRKFFPVQYEDGGFVTGDSHANGGVPFTVAGKGGYEMEGGEYIVNKKSASEFAPLLDAINNKPKLHGQSFFATGGEVEKGNGSANNSGSSPTIVRAYITKRDLRDFNSSESKISNINKY